MYHHSPGKLSFMKNKKIEKRKGKENSICLDFTLLEKSLMLKISTRTNPSTFASIAPVLLDWSNKTN